MEKFKQKLQSFIPSWWWFRDNHKFEHGIVLVNRTLISKNPVLFSDFDCSTSGNLLSFSLTDPPQAAKDRFWFLPDECVQGVQIRYQVPDHATDSTVELHYLQDKSNDNFPFVQIHDWQTREPVPPVANIERVSGFGATAYNYFCNGATDFLRFTRAARNCGIDIHDSSTRVLDWGSGCGRLTRWFREGNAHGVDIDAENVNWCQKNLIKNRYSTVGLYPPTFFEDGYFDLIFANSVLTHLTYPTMTAWLAEVRRIGRPGAIALLSFHGNFSNSYLVSRYEGASQKILSEGFFDQRPGKEMAGVIEDPDYYRQTYMSDQRALEIFENCGFKVVDVIQGYVSRCQNLAVLRI